MLKDRFTKENQPKGDLDCKVGVKRNQVQADGTKKEKKEYLWGYGSGVAAATIAGYGDVVFADCAPRCTITTNSGKRATHKEKA